MDIKSAFLAFSVFIVSLILSSFPFIVKNRFGLKRASGELMMASGGFMLATALLDLVPHVCNTADEKHDHHKGEHDHKHSHKEQNSSGCCSNKFYPGLFFAGVSYIFLLLIDTVIIKHSHCEKETDHFEHSHDENGHCMDVIKNTTSKLQAFLLLFSLSIHSIFEGLAVANSAGVSLWASLLIHKALESFSLGLTLFTTTFSKAFLSSMVFLYSMLTPLGMVLAEMVGKNKLVTDFFNGLALGSMFFIVFVEIVSPQLHNSHNNKKKMFFFMSGYLLCSGVQFLVSFNKSAV